MAISFEQPGSGPNAEAAAAAYGALQTNLATQPTQKDVFAANTQAQKDIFDTGQKAYTTLFGAQNAAQKDVFDTNQNASLQYGLADQKAQAAAAQQAQQAATQQQRDEQLNQYQQDQDEQTQQNRMDMASHQADLQEQLSQAQLSQGETLRLQRQQNALDYVENDPSLGPPGEETEDRNNARTQIQSGINPLQQRQQRAQAIASELQLQQLQQQQALTDAMGVEGDAARAQAWMRRNTFTDPTTGNMYGLDRNGNIAGRFDPESGEYVPFGLQSTRERAAAQQQQHDDQQAQQEQVRNDRQEQQRQTALSGALQTAESSLRGEFQKYTADSLRTDNRAPAPRWISDELDLWNEMIPKADGTKWTANDMTGEDIDRLVGQTAQARVQRTHPNLFPTTIDPNTWSQTGNNSPFPGASPTNPPSNPVQAAVADVAGSVMQSQQPPDADRTAELIRRVDLATRLLPEDERSTFGNQMLGRSVNANKLSEMRQLLTSAASQGRSLSGPENARYRRILAELVRTDPQAYQRLLTP